MQLQQTKTGEFTIYIEQMDETYHSRDGAISESNHVFIQEGMNKVDGDITILEVGLGTGLNAILTAQNAENQKRKVHFHTLEPFPVHPTILDQIKYGKILHSEKLFVDIHEAEWEIKQKITPHFTLHKTTQKLQYVTLPNTFYDVIYFDAFAPKKQPELWQLTIFEKLFSALKSGGILTTYSAAGQLKRDLKSAGFELIHPPGANGKREMTVATKP